MAEIAKQELLTLENRQKLMLTGVQKVEAVTPSSLTLRLHATKLIILGNNLEVKKFDREAGIFEVTGRVDALKYIDKREPKSLFKRIFG